MRILEKLAGRMVKRPVAAARVGLVLGGGAARGFAHVGVIRVLEREKIPIDLIVGTSVGSLIGAIYADRLDSQDLETTASLLKRQDLLDYSFFRLKKGLIIGKRLEQFVTKKVRATRIEDLKIPFAAVATDIKTGEVVVLNKGPLAPAVRASCALPGIFRPVEMNGRLLVDGGVVSPLPVSAAKEMGADVTIAVDVGAQAKDIERADAVTVFLQALSISRMEIRRRQSAQADVLIQPDLHRVGTFDFDRKEFCVKAGAEAARAVLPWIHEVLAARGVAYSRK